ncbi:chemotaxis protein CheD [Aliiroseovarius marinus]|uniref:chemotaxis protein CheD n=1 Tax=Aliiroseovarius marinus TaxID=2500159 RepID=UPI003D7E5D2F
MNQMASPNFARNRVYISQGEYRVSGDPSTVIATLLGSCVSACMWDPEQRVGGMNHVLFVDDNENGAEIMGHAVNGMELLINGLVNLGADRRNLRAKVFGGASMIEGLSVAGQRNAEFILDFLDREGIQYLGGDTGGVKARRLEFFPTSGNARQKLVSDALPTETVKPLPGKDSVELF